MTTTADAVEDEPGLFAGLKFFVLQRVPLRSRFIREIQHNDGEVVKLEQEADYIIADDQRPDAPDGSVNWKFVDHAVKAGILPDVDEYVIRSNAGPGRRPAGSTAVVPKKTRAEYTADQDLALRRYVWDRTKAYHGNRGMGGNEIYSDYAKVHPEHTWQSYRDRFTKRLKALGEPARERTESNISRRRDDISAAPTLSPVPARPTGTTVDSTRSTRRDASSRSPEPPSRTNFTEKEDHELCDFVYSQPPKRRRGNKIYEAYEKTNPSHTAQSWRSRFIKLEDEGRVPSGVDPTGGSSPARNDVSRASSRVPYTEEDNTFLLNFVQEHGSSATGALLYKELGQVNERHTWQSWRAQYLKLFADNAPAQSANEAVHGVQQAAIAQPLQQTEGTTPSDAVLAKRSSKNDSSCEKHKSPGPAAAEVAAMSGTYHTASPSSKAQRDLSALPDRASNLGIGDALDVHQKVLLIAILNRKPRDSKGSYYTPLEISHLILNMQDLVNKASSDLRSTMWHDWTTVMESRCAEDWKDLYLDHIYPEALRLGQITAQATQPGPARSQVATPSRKRRATTPLQNESSKRPRQGPVSSDTSSDGFSPVKVLTRSEQEQLHGSVVRRESIFEQAVHKRQAEESIRVSPARNIGGARLTAANLAAQAQAQRSIQSFPVKPVHIAVPDAEPVTAREPSSGDGDIAQAIRPPASHSAKNNAIETASDLFCSPAPPSDLFCTPAPGEGDATSVQAKYPELDPSSNLAKSQQHVHNAVKSSSSPEKAQQQPVRTAEVVGNSSSDLYTSSIQAKRPAGESGNDTSSSLPIFQEPIVQNAAVPSRGEPHVADIQTSQDADSDVDFEIPSPPGSHISLPADTQDELESSSGAHPQQHRAITTSMQQPLDDEPDAIPARTFRTRTGSSSSIEVRHSNGPRGLNTQAILDIETQALDLDVPSPGRGSLRSSPVSDAVFSLAGMDDLIQAEQQESAQDGEEAAQAMLAPYYELMGDDEVYAALTASSGRPQLAIWILESLRSGQVYEPDAQWRWSKEEDEILLGGNARLMKITEDKHGTEEYNIRVQFLNDLADSQNSSSSSS